MARQSSSGRRRPGPSPATAPSPSRNDIDYGLYEVTDAPAGQLGEAGRQARARRCACRETCSNAARIEAWDAHSAMSIRRALTCVILRAHPLRGRGYDFDVPLLAGEHRHRGHRHGLRAHRARSRPATTSKSGQQTSDLSARHRHDDPLHRRCRWLLHQGCARLRRQARHRRQGQVRRRQRGGDRRRCIEANALIARGRLRHDYPHSWRSKKPVIFRNTPQWFIAMDSAIDVDAATDTLRNRALAAIGETRWVPPQGENRIRGMIDDQARLGGVAPARLGRAHHRVPQYQAELGEL